MSTRLSRPRRTKVYDCNYTIGERYYRPVVDDLDRKYSGRGSLASAATAADSSVSSLRATLAESESRSGLSRASRREVNGEDSDEPIRRRPVSSLLDDYDSIFDGRNTGSSKSRALTSLEDDSEEFGVSSNLKRIRAARAARAQAMEDEFSITTTTRKERPALDYSEKVLDSVGLKNSDIGRARLALADDALFSKRSVKITSSSEADQESGSAVSKWSKLGAESEVDDTSAAIARARKSRARIADLDAEMEALTERTAAREKRAAGLRALVAENEAAQSSSSSSSSRKISSTVKKVSSSVTSEKKTVTF